MTRSMHLGPLQAERLAFSYSPVHEAVHSLRVLNRSGQHPLHLPWVRSIRQRMNPALKAEVAAFGVLFVRTFPDLFVDFLPMTMDFPTFDEEFKVTQELSSYNYAERVINQSIMHGDANGDEYRLEQILQAPELQQRVLKRTAELHPASVPMVEELLTQPEQSYQRFLHFFSWYWEVCMAPEWPQLEAMLLQDIHQRGKILFDRGVLEVLDSLAPQLHVYHQAENITMHYPSREQIEMRVDEQLFLAPSSYVWPRLAFVYEQDVLVAIVYSIKQLQDEGSAPVPPERLQKLLRGVGDLTRLQLLQLLSQRRRSTRELAGILGLTEAGISKHLKILQDAGFLRTERSSYYVLYQLVRDPVAEITRGLDELLQPPEHS